MSKVILFVGSSLAITLTWFFLVVYIIEILFATDLEGAALGVTFFSCLIPAVYSSWQLFIKQHASS